MKKKPVRVSRQVLLITLVMAVFLPLTVFLFGRETKRAFEERTFERLNDAVLQNIALIHTRLDGQYRLLESLAACAAALRPLDGPRSEALLRAMRSAVASGGFSGLAITDQSGAGYSDDAKGVDLSGEAFFQEAVDGGRALGLAPSGGGGGPSVVLAVPITSNAGITGTISARYETEALSPLLASGIYQGRAKSYILTADGGLIASRDDTKTPAFGAALAQVIGAPVSAKGFSEAVFLKDMAEGGSRGAVFVLYGGQRYVSYAPLGYSDWFVFCLVERGAIAAESYFVVFDSVFLSLGFTVTGLLVLFIVIYYERKKTRQLAIEQRRLRQSRERYRIVESFSDSVIFEGDFEKDIITFNKNYFKIYGRMPVLTRISDFKKPHPYILEEDMPEFLRVGRDLMEGAPYSAAEYRIRRADGVVMWHRLEFKTLFDDAGAPKRVVGRISDVEEKNKEILRLKLQAENDFLTKLYNRTATEKKTDDYLSGEGGGGVHALLIVDIDNFKSINDTMGHVEGDRALAEFAYEMTCLFRATDILGRLGGDEFIVLIKNIKNPSIVFEKAQALCDAVPRMGYINEAGLSLSCSVGVSFFNRDGGSFAELYKKADIALYGAKKQGKNRYAIYDASMG